MFKEKVKEIRKELGYTQEEFAKKLGISRSTVKDLETGANKGGNLKLLNKLCEVSGKTSSYFLEQGAEIDLGIYDVLDEALSDYIDKKWIDVEGNILKHEKELLEIFKATAALKYERKIRKTS